MRLLCQLVMIYLLSCSYSPLHAYCFDCPDHQYYYYGDCDSCYNRCGGDMCVAGQAYAQSTICNLRTGLLVGGPIVAALIAILVLTADSHSHSGH
jgi:hypothetical protein